MFKSDEVVFKTEHYSYEHWEPIGSVTDPTPTHLQPPFAGRGEEVTDSQVDAIRRAGRHVYRFVLHSADPWWFGGTPFTMEDFVAAIDKCQAYARERHGVSQLDVVADCQGALPTLIHNAQNPHLYRRHAFFAAPCNNKTGQGGTIEDYCETADISEIKARVAMFGGVQPGILQYMAFSSMHPYDAMFGRWFKLANTMMYEQDEEKCKQKVRNSLWRDNVKNLSEWFNFTLEHFFINNELYNGTMTLGGKPARLENITCPVYVSVGKDDDITLPASTEGILEKVGSEEKKYICWDDRGGRKHKHTAPFTWDHCLEHFVHHFYTVPQMDFAALRN